MAKPAIITVSREQVEADVQRETDKGKSRIEAVLHVMGNATDGIRQAKNDIEALVLKAKGQENFNDEQEAKYDSICRAILEPEYQRIGHCKNIIAELNKTK